jgi:hypothetical protein
MKKRCSRFGNLSTVLLFAVAAGCANDSNPESTEQDEKQLEDSSNGEDATDPKQEGVTIENEHLLNLIARIDMGDGQSVKFFEPQPGVLIEVESGKNDGT